MAEKKGKVEKKLLTRAEEQALFARYHAGDLSAREELITANLRLVGKLCTKYLGLSFLDANDLFQEGVIGLEHAIDAYDVKSKNKLSTSATIAIARQMKRASDNAGKGIRIPAYKQERIRKIKLAMAALPNGVEPTAEVLAEKTGMNEYDVEETLKAIDINTSSLNVRVSDGEGNRTEVGDLIVNERAKDPSELLQQAERSQAISAALSTLGDIDRSIIVKHYGLGCVQLTLTEIGDELGITHEAVRIREQKAFEKLRGTNLAEFLG